MQRFIKSIVSFLLAIIFISLASCGAALDVSYQSETGDAKAGLTSNGSKWKIWGAKDDQYGREFRATVGLPVNSGK